MIYMKSKVYRDLTPKKLTQIDVEDIDSLRSSMFAQGRKLQTSYNELQTVAVAANVQGGSGSIPKTAIIAQASNIYDNKTEIYSPTLGTWILEAVDFSYGSGSGYTNELYFTTSSGATQRVLQTTNEVSRPRIELDERITIEARSLGGSGVPSSSLASVYLMRRR